MELLFFVGFIATLTLLVGLIFNILMGIPISLMMTYKKSYINIIIINIFTRLILTSIITLAILNFVYNRTDVNLMLYYIIGFYSFMVMFTLIDSENTNIANSENDYNMQKAFNFNRYLVIITLFYFILAINFPFLLNFYIPSKILKISYWLIDFKFFNWVITIVGFGATIYIIKYTFVFILGVIGIIFYKK